MNLSISCTFDKAEFLLKAKEYAETNQKIEEIDQLLDLVQKELPEYEKRIDRLAEAESLMDEADRILWDKKFKKAKELYTKTCDIYDELDDDFGIAFCEKSRLFRRENCRAKLDRSVLVINCPWLFWGSIHSLIKKILQSEKVAVKRHRGLHK